MAPLALLKPADPMLEQWLSNDSHCSNGAAVRGTPPKTPIGQMGKECFFHLQNNWLGDHSPKNQEER